VKHDGLASRHIELSNGLCLRVVEWDGGSERPPFVLVHGLASNALLWRGAAEELAARGHRVVAVDQRGHGHSDKPDEGYDMATVAGDLAGLLESLETEGIDRPVVAGQSWGGNVVLELAYRRPRLIRGAVAVDGGFLELREHFPEWESCAVSLQPPRLEGTSAESLRQYLRSAHPDWPESGIEGAMANMEHLPDGTIRPWLRFERHMSILRGLWEHRPSAIYGAIEVPVMLVPAEGPRGVFADTKREAVERAARMLPRSRVEWFSPADHDLHAQHPERFADVVHGATIDGFFA
jgi:pimeloyl-ACP methyl ester carboxylesterase